MAYQRQATSFVLLLKYIARKNFCHKYHVTKSTNFFLQKIKIEIFGFRIELFL